MTKILLVEDDKSLREIYGTRLLAENYDIVSAGDGEEALAMAIKEKPDLIISDVMMPKISGFDMLDILRSTTETRDIKVIMMTALSSDDQRTRGEQLGADKYLVKSQVGIEDVVHTVHEVLGDGNGASTATATPSTESAPAAVPTTADDTATSTDTSDMSVSTTDDSSTSVPDDAAATDGSSVSSTEPAASGSAPGNDAAGPLPPQPSEVKPLESTLPQPTAPFSSPRPVNLGEEALHPADSAAPTVTTGSAPEVPATDPDTAAPALVPAEPATAPASENEVDLTASNANGLGFDLDPKPAGGATGADTATPTDAASSVPETPDTTLNVTPPSDENKDQTPPAVGPATPAA